MKNFRAIFVVVALLCTVPMALADSIPDPRIVIGGDSDSTGVGMTFSFSSSLLGGGYYADPVIPPSPPDDGRLGTGFFNDSGVPWTTLGIWVPIPYEKDINGIPQPILLPASYSTSGSIFFNTVGFFPDTNTGFMLIFFHNVIGQHLAGLGGIPVDGHFSIDLRNLDDSGAPYSDGQGGWRDINGQGGVPFNAVANYAPVPEPGSLTLFLGGLGLIGIRLIRGKKATKRG